MSDDATRTVFRTCPLCEATCGLVLTVQDDRILEVRGDDDDVFSHGFLCPKGTALGALEADPDRLRTPRVKRDGVWHEATWQEALEVVAAGLAPILADDRNAVSVYLGNPNVHNLSGTFYAKPLLKALGTRSVFTATSVDQLPKHLACGLMYGAPGSIPVPDLDRTDWLLMLGANPLMSNGSLCTAPDFPGRLKAIRARGGKVIVVDPVRTRTAKKADEYLAIRPGSDAAFLAALAHVLFAEDLVDLGELAGHVDGVEDVRSHLAPFTPQWAEARTGVPATTIERLAREFAAAERAAVYGRLGTSTVSFGATGTWLIDVLNILTGNLDRPGGVMWPTPAHATVGTPRRRDFEVGRWHSRVRDRPEMLGELPVATLAEEIDSPGEGRIRALITVAGNPIVSTPNATRLEAAVASLDFHIAIDMYINETSRHADVILPPPGNLARGHYDAAFYQLAVRNVANYSPPVNDADGMQEWEVLLAIAAIALGQPATTEVAEFDDLVAGQLLDQVMQRPGNVLSGRDREAVWAQLQHLTGPERLLEILLQTGPYGDAFSGGDGLSLAKLEANPHGIDYGALVPRRAEVVSTGDGQIHLAPSMLIDDLSRLAALPEPDPATLVLVGRRHLRSNNSWMHNIPQLTRGADLCTLQINPVDAERLGLTHGEPARIRARVGQVDAPVEVTEDIAPGVVSLPHGYGHDVEGVELSTARAGAAGVNSNVLSDEQDLDPVSGNAVLNGITVTVETLVSAAGVA